MNPQIIVLGFTMNRAVFAINNSIVNTNSGCVV